MAVRPIRSEASNEVLDLLKKAKALEEKIEKANMCPCGSGKPKAKCCPEMKKERTHKLGSFTPGAGGVNEGSCADDCWCKIEKASPDFITSFSTEPQDVTFVSESGGQTRNAYYTTNQHLLDSTDVANKGASKSSVDIATLSDSLNTHGHPVKSHLTEG
tara:strand:+ start:277 stop:753 length:477 start_codon:yes stop_codon:yes gene_type:complete